MQQPFTKLNRLAATISGCNNDVGRTLAFGPGPNATPLIVGDRIVAIGIGGQMRVMTLSEGSPYETLHSYVSAAVAPYFKSFVRESGKADRTDNPLKNAPHTHHLLLDEDWSHPYSKQRAFFPLVSVRNDKYWPPVGRIDNVAGDRNLVCSCPPMEAYRNAAE